MKNFKTLDEKNFFKLPVSFNKYTEKDILAYAVGANLYMNGLIDFYSKIVSKELEDCTTITICFEDAIEESNLPVAEMNFVENLNKLLGALDKKIISYDDIPLIFIRFRNIEQFKRLTENLTHNLGTLITGFIFPKVTIENVMEYFNQGIEISNKIDEKFYFMPILESEEAIYKENRIQHLLEIKDIFEKYKDFILNIRVGGTDFSSKFGLRRNVDFSIYDIKVVSDCLVDIINIFSRGENPYIISAVVWEYFSSDSQSKEVRGLLREVKLDQANGFIGKTVIHPSQVNYVNSAYIVSYENYMDAIKILEAKENSGVFKGHNNNKMNEVSPHSNWAKKIIKKAMVFGVKNQYGN